MRKMRKLARIWMVAAVALLMAGPALADELTQTAEPFARSAAIYGDGFHAFAPRAALPTREDFETLIIGYQDPKPGVASGSRPWTTYGLREPGRFTFELQRPWGDLEEALGVGK